MRPAHTCMHRVLTGCKGAPRRGHARDMIPRGTDASIRETPCRTSSYSALRRPAARPRTPKASSGSTGGQSKPPTVIQTFDNRRQLIVCPGEIKPGDWLSDLGTLRQVASVDALSLKTGPGMIHILHFEDQPGVANKALGFSTQADLITIWREQ